MKDSALIVVDMLYDFIDGSLACQEAEKAVAGSLEYIKKSKIFPILFIRDHHPLNHCSFQAQGGPWPEHCVQGTHGADIHTDLAPYATEEFTFYKGENPEKEQYSGFEGMNHAGQSLHEVLQIMEIRNVYICGIATEFCVRNTAEDLLKAGYRVTVLANCISYVDSEGHEKAIKEMAGEGIRIKK